MNLSRHSPYHIYRKAVLSHCHFLVVLYGASHVLQEILTIKSDDVVGRSKAYEAIVKGEPMPTPGIPESLNVLLHELRGLGLSVNLE